MQHHFVTFFISRGLLALGLLLACLPFVSVGQDHVPQFQIKVPTDHFPISSLAKSEEDLHGFSSGFGVGTVGLNRPDPQPWNLGGMNQVRFPDPSIQAFSSGPLIGPVWSHETSNPSLRSYGQNLGEEFWDSQGKANDDPISLQILEENSKEFRLNIDEAPLTDVTVAVTGFAGTDLTVSPSTFTLTPTDYEDKTITLTAGQDDDEINDEVALTISYNGETEFVLEVEIVDDEQIWELSPLIVEEGASRVPNIPLAGYFRPILGLPTGDVSVTLTGYEGSTLIPRPTTFEFLENDLWISQPLVLLSELDDDSENEEVTLLFTASGGGYTGLKYSIVVTIEEVAPYLITIPEGTGGRLPKITLLSQESYPSYFGAFVSTFSGHEDSDLSVTPSSVSHPIDDATVCYSNDIEWPYCWDPIEDVFLDAAHDADDQDDQITLLLRVTGPDREENYFLGVSYKFIVTIEDDDDPGIEVSPVTLRIPEGETRSVTIRLTDEPLENAGTEDVTVTIPESEGDFLTISPSSLTFTNANWNEWQSVQFTAQQDDDFQDHIERFIVAASGGGYDGEKERVTVLIVDDDEPGLIVSPPEVFVPEGGEANFSVTLAARPSGRLVLVRVPTFEDPALTRDADLLLFFRSQYNTPSVRVFAAEDPDAVDETESITLVASGGGYDDITQEVTIKVIDNDHAGIALSTSSLNLTEGDLKTYSVRLTSSPSSQVTINIVESGDGGITFSSQVLRFTASNWDEPQEVSVQATQDDNSFGEVSTLTHTATSTDLGYHEQAEMLTVTVRDDDHAGIELTPPSLNIVEEGTRPYSVRLLSQPVERVTINIVESGGVVKFSPQVLHFETSNWNKPQEVTVRGDPDDNSISEASSLIHTATSSDPSYHEQTATLTITVTDNDVAEIKLDPTSLNVTEGGAKTYSGQLSSEPIEPVTIWINESGGVVTFSPLVLRFSASNWNVPQEVTVQGEPDDNSTNENTFLIHTVASSGIDYNGKTATLQVTVTDNDAAGIELIPSSLSVTEGDAATYSVRLLSEPVQVVTVNIVDSEGIVSLSPQALNFSASNWDVLQEVIVRADSDENAVNEMSTLFHTTASSDPVYHGKTDNLQITVIDKDAAGIELIPTLLTINEGNEGVYSVRLFSQPTAPVTVNITASEEVAMYSPQVLRFSASNWNEAQEVTVRADPDDNTINETFTLNHTATSSDPDYDGTTANLLVTILDNDVAGIELIPTSLEVTEEDTETYTVQLMSEPAEPVTITIIEAGGITSSPQELSFTVSDWNEPQDVTLYAEDDDNTINETFSLIHTATSSDPHYNGKIATLTVAVIDNDVVGILLTPNSLEVTEENTETYSVQLMSAPVGLVTIHIPESEESVTLSTEKLQFTSSNWNEPQEVILTANADDNTIHEDFTLIHTATSSDPSYNGITAPLLVTVMDNDVAEIQLIPTSLTLTEGGTETYSVQLQTEPSEPVTVNIAEASEGLTVAQLALLFTTSNWGEQQEVTVRSDPDDNTVNESITLLHTASSLDQDYNGKTATLPITVIDGDVSNLVVNPTDLMMEEGTSTEFTVQLSSAPAVLVTVQLPNFTNQDLTHDQSTLTFTPSTWSEPQTVKVSANKDDDAEDENPETLTLTAVGGKYDGITEMVTVRVEDTDQKGIRLNPLSLELEEGGAAGTYTVELQSAPTSTMTITVTGLSNKVTLDQESLIFSPSNWSDPQTMTIHALDDRDTDNERLTLTHSASGGGYDDETASLEVGISDLGVLTVSISDAEVNEGAGYADMQVELSQPTDRLVSVRYQAVAEDADAGLDYQDSRGIVLFSSGSTKGKIRLDIIDDEIPEPDETFAVVLSNVRNADILRGIGRVTILDNDGGLIIWIDDEVAFEENGKVQFTVHLSQPSSAPVVVSYRTENGTAIAGEDYLATSGVLTFAPGMIKEEIVVELLTDEFDWREETFTVHLESLGKTQIEKAVAIATIQEATSVSSEVMKAYTARFIRTSTVQIVEALHQRFQSRMGASSCSAGERMVMAQMWGATSGWEPSLSELLAGCHLSGNLPGGGLSVWGRGSFTRFNGQGEDALRLRADVTTAMVGTDYTWRKGWMAGLLVSHSQGDGSFDVFEESGGLHSGLTGLIPYVSVQGAEWGAWMAMGYGQGRTEVQELEGDLVSMFGTAGGHGEWASSASVGLTVHGDILYSGAEVDEHAVSVQVYRVRAGLGSDLRISKVIRPYVEANIRRDGGSAETGTGLELSGGIRLAYPAWRLRGEMRTQGLVIHSADGFTEWGLSGLVQFGNGPEGFVVSVRPSWGPNQGGVLLRQKTILETTPVGTNHNQIKMEMAYGLPFQSGVMRSVAGMTQLFTGRMYRLGVELQPWEAVNVSMFGVTYPNANAQRGIGLNLRGSVRY